MTRLVLVAEVIVAVLEELQNYSTIVVLQNYRTIIFYKTTAL